MEEVIYKKGDKEYIKNGHYLIEGEEWMSMWAFKKEYKIFQDPYLNTSDTLTMNQGFFMSHRCLADTDQTVRFIFMTKDLKEGFGLL